MPVYLTLYHKRSAVFSSRKTEERGYQPALEQLCLFKEENLKKKKNQSLQLSQICLPFKNWSVYSFLHLVKIYFQKMKIKKNHTLQFC